MLVEDCVSLQALITYKVKYLKVIVIVMGFIFHTVID